MIQIAERDTQTAAYDNRPNEFVITWSIDGFAGEACQPAELGWGTHGAALPLDGCTHDFGGGAATHLLRHGASTRVRTRTPSACPIHGFLITQNEPISVGYAARHDTGGAASPKSAKPLASGVADSGC